jgi:hypothetical protein
MLEFVVLLFVLIIIIVYITSNPQLARQLDALFRQFAYLEAGSDNGLRLITPYLTKPGVVVSIITLFSVITPLMEEALKPLGVWLIAGKLNTKAQGFALGALCGAGFALVETLNTSAQTNDWANLLFARIGTGAMHITTSALLGAAIASVWLERRYLRLFGTYLIAVLIHGLWNFAALSYSFSKILVKLDQPGPYQTIQAASAAGLVVISFGLVAILIFSNRKHSRVSNSELQVLDAITKNNTE